MGVGAAGVGWRYGWPMGDGPSGARVGGRKLEELVGKMGILSV